MTAFNKRMDTLESKLMYDSEKLYFKKIIVFCQILFEMLTQGGRDQNWTA